MEVLYFCNAVSECVCVCVCVCISLCQHGTTYISETNKDTIVKFGNYIGSKVQHSDFYLQLETTFDFIKIEFDWLLQGALTVEC